jgi:hypothetical protein
MMQFQHNFVKTVKDMRVTSKTIPHTIFDYPNFDDGEDAKVFHDDALLHHWREAAAACELYMLNSLFVYGIIIACSRLVKVEAKKVKNANNRNSSDFLKDFDTKYGLRRDDPHELPRSRDFHKWEGLQSTIRVVNVELRTEVLDIIGPALLHNPYKTVHFEKNMLDRKGVLFVIEYLKRNDAAENFFFDGNAIETEEAVSMLS